MLLHKATITSHLAEGHTPMRFLFTTKESFDTFLEEITRGYWTNCTITLYIPPPEGEETNKSCTQ